MSMGVLERGMTVTSPSTVAEATRGREMDLDVSDPMIIFWLFDVELAVADMSTSISSRSTAFCTLSGSAKIPVSKRIKEMNIICIYHWPFIVH